MFSHQVFILLSEIGDASKMHGEQQHILVTKKYIWEKTDPLALVLVIHKILRNKLTENEELMKKIIT